MDGTDHSDLSSSGAATDSSGVTESMFLSTPVQHFDGAVEHGPHNGDSAYDDDRSQGTSGPVSREEVFVAVGIWIALLAAVAVLLTMVVR